MFTWKRLVLAMSVLILTALPFISLLLPGILIRQAQGWAQVP